jgi:uncharacterized protein (TIGR00661 family)
MKGILIIQGEGRGHISQAISYCQRNKDIEIVCLIISCQREIKDEYFEYFGNIPLIQLKSLNLFYKDGRVSLSKTFFNNLLRLPIFIKNLSIVNKWIKHYDPDLVLNFYEPLSILSTTFNKTKKISIANQYLFYLDNWKVPHKNKKYFSINIWNNITSFNSDQILAPSFIQFPKNGKVETIKPLIRDEIKGKLEKTEKYTLVYLIDEYYINLFKEYARKKEEKYVLFCDNKFITPEYKKNLPKNIELFEIDFHLFTEKLLKCEKVIATGGFQLICEALYLNKRIEIIPLHYEQEINGYNLEIHKLGRVSDIFS